MCESIYKKEAIYSQVRDIRKLQVTSDCCSDGRYR